MILNFLYTKVLLILILINVQCLQNVIFSFENSSNILKHSFSDSHNPIKHFCYSTICSRLHLGEFPPTLED